MKFPVHIKKVGPDFDAPDATAYLLVDQHRLCRDLRASACLR